MLLQLVAVVEALHQVVVAVVLRLVLLLLQQMLT
jgi:hypothetical protein